jgi:preprotein translocase subunit Sss1
MAKKKESAAKKVGRFVTDELLGVDDAKRAYKKARKGDIKGALKSAATGAFELGTTATAFGKGGMLAAKAGSKMVSKKTVEKSSTEIGQRAGRKVVETTKPANISREGKKFNKKVEGKAQIKSKSGSTSTASDSKRISGTTRKPTAKEYIGRVEAAAKKRTNKIVGTAIIAKGASKPVVKKVAGDTAVKFAARGMVAQKGISEYNKNKKKSK